MVARVLRIEEKGRRRAHRQPPGDGGRRRQFGIDPRPLAPRGERELLRGRSLAAVLGTPPYMAPEQARGSRIEIDERTDVYGAGAVLYEILTLTPPHRGSTAAECIGRPMQEPVEPASQRAPERRIPPRLEAIAAKALAHRPDDRYPSVQALGADLRFYLEGPRRNVPMLVLAALAVALAVALLLLADARRRATQDGSRSCPEDATIAAIAAPAPAPAPFLCARRGRAAGGGPATKSGSILPSS